MNNRHRVKTVIPILCWLVCSAGVLAVGYVAYDSFYGYERRVRAEQFWLSGWTGPDLKDTENWNRLVGDAFAWGYPWGPSRKAWMVVRSKAIVSIGRSMRPEALDLLLETLDEEDVEIKTSGLGALSCLGDRRAVTAVLSTLRSPDPMVRAESAITLGSLKDAQAVEPLIEALKDPVPAVAEEAASSLGNFDDVRAVGPLIEALKDESPNVAGAAASSLGNLDYVRAVGPLIEALKNPDARVHDRAVKALCLLDSARAIEPVLLFLQEKDPRLVLAAAEILRPPLNAGALEPLLSIASSGDACLRERAARALGELGDTRALETLAACMKDPEAQVAAAAAEALGLLGDPRAFEPLVLGLQGRDYQVQLASARALRSLGDGRAFDYLVRALDDPEPVLSYAAAEALEKWGTPEAILAILSSFARDSEARFRFYSPSPQDFSDYSWALEVLENRLQGQDLEDPRFAAFFLGSLGDSRVVPLLVRSLEDQNFWMRDKVVELLGILGDSRALDGLTSMMRKDPEERFRVLAAVALNRLEDPGAVGPLLEALRDSSPYVRARASFALAIFDDPRIFEALQPLMRESDLSLAPDPFATPLALGLLGDERAYPLLQSALKEGSAYARAFAVRGLACFGSPDAGQLLVTAIQDDRSVVRKEAAQALSFFPGDASRNALRSALTDANLEVRFLAATSLALHGDEEGLHHFLPAAAVSSLEHLEFSHPLLPKFVIPYESPLIVSLARLKRIELLDRFVRFLDHPESEYRRAASLALSRLPAEAVRQALSQRPALPRSARDKKRLERLFALHDCLRDNRQDQLKELAADPDPVVSVLASGFLFNTDSEGALSVAVSWFKSRPHWVKQNAWDALVAYGDLLPEAFLDGLQERVGVRWSRKLRHYRALWKYRKDTDIRAGNSAALSPARMTLDT